ncbi:MAG: hypothetical protein OQJ84_08845 [Xanthomonadales bacterium]|nr:hypothetical protein [Xanthomonadales bacterium]
MNFAKRVFFWSGVYGIVVLLPMYFLEEKIGHDFPPATNHPEQYYAFLGVALAWQFAFLLVAGDPLRYRPLMIPAIAEKLLAAGAVIWLYLNLRIDGTTLAPFLVDVLLGGLFIISYIKTAKYVERPPASGDFKPRVPTN